MDQELFRSLRHRPFRLFFVGQVVSVTGAWLQITAMPWLVYRLTGSALLLGLIGFLSQVFVLLLAPVAGIIADQYDRKRLLIMTQSLLMLQALLLAWLAWNGAVALWHLVVLSTFLGLVNAFDMTVRQAFVVDLVPRADLMNAIGLNSTVFNAARMVGPALAGVLIAAGDESICFLINGVTFLGVIAALAAIRPLPQRADGTGRFIDKFLAGVAYVRSSRRTTAILALLAVTGLVAVFPMTLMPVFVKDVYRMGAEGFGVFMSAVGIGAIVGTLTVAGARTVRGIERTIFWSALGLGTLVMLFATVRSVPAACLLLAGAGYCVALQMSLSNTYIQLTTPDDLRGRVLGFFIMAFMGFAPIGSFASGALAHRVGAPATVALGGLLAAAAALLLRSRIIPRTTEAS